MDLPNRSRANHAVRYVCPEWTWPADELIHIREMSERTSVPASSLRYYEKLGLITSERETSGSQRRYSKATFYKIILITLAQSAGFNLDEIAEQLRTYRISIRYRRRSGGRCTSYGSGASISASPSLSN